MKIVTYNPKYREDFVRLNTEWLTRFYWVESFDQYAMDHVEELIAQGAMVFFALDDNEEVMATCMAMLLEGSTWEICKLAAKNQYTGTGAGSAVLQAAMDYAEKHGAKKEVLISCRDLKPAIHLYQKFGFHEVPYRKEFWKSEKADIEMEREVLNNAAMEEHMTFQTYNEDFWKTIDTLVSSEKIVIDRPKGSTHRKFPHIKYEVDYGYVENTSSMDGVGIDVWRGSLPSVNVDAIICTIDLMKKDSEMKLLIGCTEEEMKAIYNFHNNSEYMKGMLIHREKK